MDREVAIIGGGNMGGAIARGIARAGDCNVTVCDLDRDKLSEFEQIGLNISTDLQQVLSSAGTVVLAVKPKVFPELLKELSGVVNDKLLVSVAAGISLERIRTILGTGPRLARVMPNLPCSIGKGVSAIYFESEEDRNALERIFSTIGEVVFFESEHEVDLATGLSGSGPAFIFEVIDSLAEGAERMGLGRKQALELATQTTIGAAELLSRGEDSPAELREKVATPGGTTEQGLNVIDNSGLRKILIDTVEASTKKALEGM